MKILVLFAVGVLGCSLAGAAIVSRCELINKLKTEIQSHPEIIQQSGLTSDDFVAKIVCYVDKASKFNTSLVTELSSDEKGGKSEGNNGGKSEGNNGGKSEGNNGGKSGGNNGGKSGGNNGGKSEGNKGGNNEGNKGGNNGGDKGGNKGGNNGGDKGGNNEGNKGGNNEGNKGGNSGGHRRRRRSSFGGLSSEESYKNKTLYGLFQLCGDLVCNSTLNSTTGNLCNIHCNDLIDDNIDDDIKCVLKFCTTNGGNCFNALNVKEFGIPSSYITQDDCKQANATVYLAGCE